MTTEATSTDDDKNLPGERINKPKISRTVPVKLTTEELAQRAKGVGEKGLELDKLREKVAEKSKELKDQVKTAETEFDAAVSTLRSGTEDRIVTCHERFHAGTIITIREDTFEVVGSPRPATAAERQVALPGQTNGTGLLESATDAQKQTGFPDDDEKPDAPFNPPRRGRKGKKPAS